VAFEPGSQKPLISSRNADYHHNVSMEYEVTIEVICISRYITDMIIIMILCC